MNEKKIKKAVRDSYGKIARGQSKSCCGPNVSSCCGSPGLDEIGKKIGYSGEELKSVPEGANLGLGCGNPTALAMLKPGDTVLDLGSGGGFDCFLAAGKVGKHGKVIGVDMTPEMVARARKNASAGGYENVEFRLGEIEHLPLADNSVDLVISNCVINLAPDKAKVFAEVYRVLKPGGRFTISDMVVSSTIPDFIRESLEARVGCLGASRDEYLGALEAVAFEEIKILKDTPLSFELLAQTIKEVIRRTDISEEQIRDLAGSVQSITVSGVKPREAA
ncbi:MAG TPA: arsenite methyltransferase [archaeon]|nr:arsenite methyltransferase [archaeon]